MIDIWIVIIYICIFLLPLIPFNLYLLLRMFINCSTNLLYTSFETLGSIPIFDVSLLDNLPRSFIFYFKERLSVELSPSTTIFTLLGAFIARSIIIPYKDYNTVVKYINKAHLFFLVQSSASSHTVDILDTNIPDSKISWINESYKNVNHVHLFHCHHLFMNAILILFHYYLDQLNLENIQYQLLPFIIACFCPNIDLVFIYQLFSWTFLHNLTLTLYCFHEF